MDFRNCGYKVRRKGGQRTHDIGRLRAPCQFREKHRRTICQTDFTTEAQRAQSDEANYLCALCASAANPKVTQLCASMSASRGFCSSRCADSTCAAKEHPFRTPTVQLPRHTAGPEPASRLFC